MGFDWRAKQKAIGNTLQKVCMCGVMSAICAVDQTLPDNNTIIIVDVVVWNACQHLGYYLMCTRISGRWKDIVTDLTRRSPEIFNIRHTERGVQTRNTKRKGGNLHCLMAFKRVESIPSGFFFNVEQAQDEQTNSQSADEADLQVPASEVEDLNSSDSDYPMEMSEHNHVSDRYEEATQTSLTDTGKQVLEAWRTVAGAGALAAGENSNSHIGIPVEDLEIEDVDSPRVDVDEQDGVDDPLDSTLTEDQQTFSTMVHSSPQDELDDPLSNSLQTSPNVPVIQATPPPPQSATSPTLTRRGRTFRKKRMSLSPNRAESSSDEDSERSPSVKRRSRSGAISKGKQTHPDGMGSPSTLEVESPSGGGVQRRGTFTKEVPTIRVERMRPLSTTSNSSDQEDVQNSDHVAKEAVDFDSPAGSGLRRSGTFTKSTPHQSDHLQAPPSNSTMADVNVSTESGSPGSNLRRSGTFTKEKPDIIIVPKARETSTSSSSEKETFSDPETEFLSSTGLKRSGTFTIEKPNGVTTGEHHNTDTDLLDYEIVDLDDTLKDTRTQEDDSDDQNSEGSVEETLVLTEMVGGPLKKSGTFTKEKPFLS